MILRKIFPEKFFFAALFTFTSISPAFAFSNSTQKTIHVKTSEQQANSLLWFLHEPQAQAVWSPFGVSHPGARSLGAWVKNANNARSVPNFTNSLSLNCWEYVLYTALRLEKLDLKTVKALYGKRTQGEKLSENFGSMLGTARYTIHKAAISMTWPSGIEPGDVVFMDETSHVVQLLGERDEGGRERVVSFSPRPIWGDGSQEMPVPSLRPEITTVESLIEQMVDLYPDVPTDWQNIELKIVRPIAEKKK